MAEKYSFQIPVPCADCENPAQYECQNCDDALCSTCTEKHKKKKQNHKIILYSERGKRICTKHNENKYIYWCKKCEKPCCEKCAITSHKAHDLDGIEDAICAKKHSITKELNRWKIHVQEAERMTTEYKDNIQKIDEDLLSHASRIHAAVDKILAKTRKELKDISDFQITRLQTQTKTIRSKYEKVQRQLDDLLRSSDISILQNKEDVADLSCLPTLVDQPSVIYNPGQVDDQLILSLLGYLNSAVQDPGEEESSTEESGTPREGQLASLSPRTAFYNQPVVSSFHPDYQDLYIASNTASGLSWVKTGQTRIQLMDINGEVKHTINTTFKFYDITVTPRGNVLLASEKFRIVSASKGVTSWRIRRLFSTPYRPWGICCLRNGDIVVTYRWADGHQVIQYNKEGVSVYEFDSSLFSSPCRVAVNVVNDNLYVCDVGTHKLLAFGSDHSLRYEYTGSDLTSFQPKDVSADANGHILVTDKKGNRIHVLDQNGNFLHFLQPPGLVAPQYIDVDSEGNVWIGEDEGRVKILTH